MDRRMHTAAVAAALTMALTVPVLAHMKVAKAIPAPESTVSSPPRSVQIWFTQQPDAAVSRLEVSGPALKPVQLTGVHAMPDKSLMGTVPADLADGVYTLRWQSAGDDGHVQKGEYTFTVKRAR